MAVMADMLSRELSIQMRRANSAKASQADFAPRQYIVQGKFLCDGAGEVARDVLFPVPFIEEPFFYFGGRLEENQAVVQGQFPRISAVVISFVEEPQGRDQILYKGARLAIVTEGLPDQRMWVNWHFNGIALVNPIGGTDTVEGTI